MRIGMSTACFYPQPLEEALPIIAELGVRAIEIFFNTESEFQPRFYEALGAQTRSLGLDVISVHPYTSLMEGMLLFSDYTRRTEDGLVQYQRYFECAAALGARFLTFHGERHMGQQDSPARWERKCAVYQRLCEIGAACGVTLAQENVAWCRSSDPAFIHALYRDVPALRYTLDIKQAYRAGQSWKTFMDVMGERLVNVHINDFAAEQSCLMPGEGTMDYADFFSRLRTKGYQGHTIIEVYRTNFDAPEELGRAVHTLSRFASV
ncbi:sugar phosphate isomerase/epimerase family protein [Candidatus Agathobaculum pullicola]|uniref:sugar phosphate isomerase/epimerase family protein n=1 Tax=Candidatus Agathobaculum pullicola TaxID=2838426 RepID=UPI003F8ED5F6